MHAPLDVPPAGLVRRTQHCVSAL